ncbi:amidohydrolase family protein [Neotabrizicola shimadae]|uniref:Amidohydrolase n=1 Tax=Neotabrizicola shimadae TaxID=2807096 RepID=A0A8G0ZY01_9RHOB|nr:amidohydrolase [Neotabrizicola shimadae]QYZ70149.1 amidohydrolase [Neotabrizicola shimadae]
MDLIDTHLHLIYRGRIGYGWTVGIEALQGDFTLDDHARLTAGKGVAGTVFMETGVDDADYQAEARMVAELVKAGRMMGQIASIRPETDEGFDAWLEQSDDLEIVGYRRILHVMPDDTSQAEGFRRNLRKIGARGLPFDLCFLAGQLPLAVDLVRACPNQTFVLDHCGVPDVAGGAFEAWSEGMKAVAALPQVNVKLSGITAYCAPGTANLETVRPWVERVVDLFGPERIVWGGDWPVVNLGVGLPAWIDMTRALLAGLSAAEQDAIGQGNARRIYGLD